MTSIEKFKKEQVLELMLDIYRRYGIVPGVGFIAGVIKSTPHTIHNKMAVLEAEGMIVQIKKIKNNVSYRLTEKALSYGK